MILKMVSLLLILCLLSCLIILLTPLTKSLS
jgi:hypothetical protein